MQNRVPQGEVFSVPIFLIAINDITKRVDFPFSQWLFADDYNINHQTADLQRAHRLLPKMLDKANVRSHPTI